MKHSVEELTTIAYQYFPRQMWNTEPEYVETEEYRRRFAARATAGADTNVWRAMLRRIGARFPEERYPDVMAEDRSIFLRSPTTGPGDRSLCGVLWLPVRGPHEKLHELTFFVSFVVPYYFVCSGRAIYIEPPTPDRNCKFTTSFELSPDELPFAKGIVEEIEATYPGHEPMPPEVGQVIVPEASDLRGFGETTLYDCLFTDQR
jgi:hypothetical protein